MQIRLAGIYNQHSLKWLEDRGHDQFEFDLRPKSFQFIPHYQAHELMQGAAVTSHFVAHFHDEYPLLVDKFVADSEGERLQYLFSGLRDLEFLSSFSRPFGVELNFENIIEFKERQLINRPKLRLIALTYDHLHHELMSGTIAGIVGDVATFKREQQIELELRVRFGQDLAPSLFGLFSFDRLVIELGSQVEVSYRQFSPELFKGHLEKLSSLYPEIRSL